MEHIPLLLLVPLLLLLPGGARADVQAESCIFASPATPLSFSELTSIEAQLGCNQLAECQVATPWVLFADHPGLESTIQCDHERVSVCSSNIPVAYTLPHLYEAYIDRPLTTAGFPQVEIWTNRGADGAYQACTYARTDAYPALWNATQVDCSRPKTWLCVCTRSETLLSTSIPTKSPTRTPSVYPSSPGSSAPSAPGSSAPPSSPSDTLSPTTSPTPTPLLDAEDAAAFAQLSIDLNRTTWVECYHQVDDPCMACDTVPSDPFGIGCENLVVRLRALQSPAPPQVRRITELRFPNLGIRGELPVNTLARLDAVRVFDFSSNVSLPDENQLTLPPGQTCVFLPRCLDSGVTCRFDPWLVCQPQVAAQDSAGSSWSIQINYIIGGVIALCLLVLGTFLYARRSARPSRPHRMTRVPPPPPIAAWPTRREVGLENHALNQESVVGTWSKRLREYIPEFLHPTPSQEETPYYTHDPALTPSHGILRRKTPALPLAPASPSPEIIQHEGPSVKFEERVKRRTGEWEVMRPGAPGPDENTIVLSLDPGRWEEEPVGHSPGEPPESLTVLKRTNKALNMTEMVNIAM